jgi:MFS family permease
MSEAKGRLMAEATVDRPAQAKTSFAHVSVVVAAVFLGFMTVGVPLPVLPVFIHDQLGFSSVMVGWVIAAQSIATLLSRPAAAALSDSKGPRAAATAGLCACAVAALLYMAASSLVARPALSLAALYLGRGALGLSESLLITGALAWGIGLAGPARTGKVMAWVGIAMYGALAAGAPVGWGLLPAGGFFAVAVAAMAFPFCGLLAARLAPPVAGAEQPPVAFVRAVAAVWQFGSALAFATIAFGALVAFLPLFYAARHWTGTAAAFTAFGGAYVLVRLIFGGLPDRVGGRPVALVSLLVEAIGQALLWRAAGPEMAMLGAALTGCGFSLVFPALGTLAVRSAASMPRGVVLGAYVAFFDLSLAVTGPVAGLLAERGGYSTVFLLGALGAAASLILTLLSPPASTLQPRGSS